MGTSENCTIEICMSQRPDVNNFLLFLLLGLPHAQGFKEEDGPMSLIGVVIPSIIKIGDM